ncbi:MAG: hypothetical protein AAGH46_09320 [Bacteroidota bacterium]
MSEISNTNYELIQDYLDGLLDQEASLKVGKLIDNDEVAYNIAKGILLLRKEFVHDESQIEEYLNSIYKRQQSLFKLQKTSKYATWLKIAAVLTVVTVSAFITYRFYQPSLEEMINAELAVPYKGTVAFRDSQKTELSAGLTAYVDENYLRAAELLEGINDAEAVFYHGLCRLYLEEYETAIKLFNSDIVEQSRYAIHSSWFLALSYYKLGDRENVRKLLKKIIAQNHYKKTEAIKLLNKIEA